MTETSTEKTVCEKCGAEAREGTIFCYNCGAKVPDPSATEIEPEISIGETEADALLAKAFSETEKADASSETERKSDVSSR